MSSASFLDLPVEIRQMILTYPWVFKRVMPLLIADQEPLLDSSHEMIKHHCLSSPSLSEVIRAISNPDQPFNDLSLVRLQSQKGDVVYESMFAYRRANDRFKFNVYAKVHQASLTDDNVEAVGEDLTLEQVIKVVTLYFNNGYTLVSPNILYIIMLNRTIGHRLPKYQSLVIDSIVDQYHQIIKQLVTVIDHHFSQGRTHVCHLLETYLGDAGLLPDNPVNTYLTYEYHSHFMYPDDPEQQRIEDQEEYDSSLRLARQLGELLPGLLAQIPVVANQ